MQRKDRIALLSFAALALLCALWLLRGALFPAARPVATIRVDGEALCAIDLASARDQVFSIEEETGLAVTFEIKAHKIRFLSSDCPDKICVRAGYIDGETQTAVCMPNRVSVTIAEMQD